MKKIFLSAILGVSLLPHPVRAEEQYLVLWPNQREKHQERIKENAMEYEIRGHDYVNHLYATGGEEVMPVPDGFMDPEGAGLDLDPVEVDVGQVADIVKDELSEQDSQ